MSKPILIYLEREATDNSFVFINIDGVKPLGTATENKRDPPIINDVSY